MTPVAIWIVGVIGVLLLVVIVATTGVQPAGTRPVARTRLMGVARIVLALVVLVLIYLAMRGQSAG